ncbi:MAG: hypothetical protein LBH28_04950 [Oscillospiraceae bacterium]|nr:hypothetical protein [Oscillospiraceae bacterium]
MNFFETTVFYQIYPLGLLGAELDNDFDAAPMSRLPKLLDWIPHLNRLGVGAIYICPVFESSRHGYDTRDFFKVDRRLGTNDELAGFVNECHKNEIKVVLDAVFNHVGREFWAFQDIFINRERSQYTGWFHVNFSGNSNYNDGFWYEGWEGHYDLVKLNLSNPDVKKHILDAVSTWIEQFSIDGLRLDVAYLLPHEFLRELCQFCRSKKSDFWIMGEALHGDYRNLMDGGSINSVTNYECYKGLYSSFNSANMFEIAYSLNRQYGKDDWTLYKGRHLFNFVDNHDVTRIATILKEPRNLPIIYALMFTMPGIPCVYYGSEWGIQGDKKDGDDCLRPHIDNPEWNELTDFISRLSKIHKENKCLTHGGYAQLHVSDSQLVFERNLDSDKVIVAINIASSEYAAHFDANAGCGIDMITGANVDFGGGLRIKPHSAMIIGNMS